MTSFIQDNSIRLAGIGQLIGDTALLVYGLKTGNAKIGSVGLLGYTAGAIATRYGNPRAEKQLALVERELGHYLRAEGVEIPKEPTLETLHQPGGVVEHAEKFLYQYPTQLINTCFTLMGVQFTRAGMQHNQKALVASGALMIASGLSGLLIEEKKPDPKNPPQGAMQKAISWVQEKPLRLTGTLANLNQASLTIDALQERKRNPGSNAYMFKLMAVGGFVLCNTMIGMSSKGEGSGAQMDEESRGKLAEAAARVIAAQPKGAQDELLDHIAGFMATQPYVQMKAPQISALLREKVAQLGMASANTQQQGQML